MRLRQYTIALALLSALWGCTGEEIPAPVPDNGDTGDTFTITASVAVPPMPETASRAMGTAPAYGSLKLYLVEFDLATNSDGTSNPNESYYRQVYVAEEETAEADRVVFKVTLDKGTTPKVLHLVAVPAGADIASQIGYGSEATVMPGITTTGGNEAYWQRLEFPDGYGTMNGSLWEMRDDVKQRLTMVPMIRNFAQVSMVNNDTDNFTAEGFVVVNVPSSGSVAPWDASTMQFPAYLKADNTQRDYADMSYKGLFAGGANIVDTDPSASQYTATPKFIYENPFNSISYTQVIVKGRFKDDTTPSYYKIDLGKRDANGVFGYYNLLRNFNYVIRIQSVKARGYDTPGDALTGVVYNNFSFDVSTEKMLNISNGSEMIWVNFTTAVVTQNTETARTLRFRYRYKTDITAAGPSTEADYANVTVLGLKPGDVIERDPVTTDSAGWKIVTIYTKEPTSETKIQEFTVVNTRSGLGRTIKLVSHTPWEVTRNRLFAGNYNLPEQFPYENKYAQFENKAGSDAGSPLTVFFLIPDYLPEAIFPLSFTLESDNQDIENNKIGTLVVTSGTSSFPSLTSQGNRIKFVKTVTWKDYNTNLEADSINGVIVPDKLNDPSGATKIRRVRCRLLTTSTVTATTTSKIRITNPYFTTAKGSDGRPVNDGYIDVTFTRTSGQKLENAPNWDLSNPPKDLNNP